MRTEDGHIIRKCLNGEPEAFGFLVDKYKGAIYAFAYARLRDFHDAEDVTQEVFIKAYQRLRTLRRWDNFHAWIYAITSNLCKNRMRARAKRPDGEFTEDQDQEILIRHSESSYRKELAGESLRELVSEALDSLPAGYRQVLTLYYLGGMSNYEIAEFLGISPSNVRMRLSRARSQLKEDMVAMMSRTLEAERLPATFTFRVAEAVKRIKIHPMPRTAGLPWGLSFATGIVIAILSIGSRPDLPDLMEHPMSPEYTKEIEIAEVGEMPVEMLRMSRIPISFGRQGDSYCGGFQFPDQQNAVSMAPRGEGDEWPEEPTARLGNGVIGQVAYSPDGELLAIAEGTGIRLFDANDLNELGLLAEHTNGVLSMAISPDGELLASGSADAEVHLWNVAEQKHTGSLHLQGNAGGVEAVAFSPDRKTLAAKSGGTAYLWDVENREQMGVLQGEAGWLYCLAFSPDSKLLALGGVDRAVSLWDVERQEQVGLLEGHTTPVFSVAFSPDGELLASGSFETTIRLWNIEGREQVGLLGNAGKMDNPVLVTFSPNGKTLASSSSNDGTIRLWDVQDRAKIGALRGHEYMAHSIAFSPDGRALASTGLDGTVRLWDIEAQKQADLLQRSGAVYSVVFSPDGKMLASGGDDKMVRLWDVDRQEEIAALEGHTGRVRPVAFSPDGRLLASGDRDSPWTVRLWDAETQEQIRLLQGHKSVVWGVAFSPDGELLASGSLDGTVRLWNVQREELAGELRHPKGAWVRAIAFSPDGKLLASGCWDDIVYIWDVEKRKQAGTLKGHTDDVYSVAFSPDGELLASGSANGAVRLWDVERQEQVALLKGHTGEVMCVAFSPDGKLLASVSRDPEVSLWDISEQKRVALLKGHSDRGKSVAFSPDGKWLASGSADGTILLWEVNLPVPGRSVEPTGKLPGTWGEAKKTELLQNYPNPFNPETWIPFSLSEPKHVIIRIYSSTGQLIRTLDLGQKASGTYMSREKAAYWDGKNENGETAASDVYFYAMEAGESSTFLRKMVMAH